MGQLQHLDIADRIETMPDLMGADTRDVSRPEIVRTDAGLQVRLETDGFTVILLETEGQPALSEPYSPDSPEFVADAERVLQRGQAQLRAALETVESKEEWSVPHLSSIGPESLLPQSIRASVAPKSYEETIIEETLRGTIKTLTAALSLTEFQDLGRARRVQKVARRLLKATGTRGRWEVELAASLYHLGSIGLPRELVHKVNMGMELSRAEQKRIAQVPNMSAELLRPIPRLETVRQLLSDLGAEASELRHGREPEDPRTGLLLIAVDYEALRTRAYSRRLAVELMQKQEGKYSKEFLEALEKELEAEGEDEEVREIPVKLARAGMVFAEDVRKQNGVLFVSKGFTVNRKFLQHVSHFPPGAIQEPVKVIVPAEV